VVERVLVQPNDPVTRDQPLVALDPTRLRSRLEVARKALTVAEAEYRQAAQQAFADARANTQLAALQGRLEQQKAELAYLETLEQRLTVTAPHDGVALFDDTGDWAGRPVALGERIMLVADPAKAELEVWMPVSDAVDIAPGAPVSLFLNTSPGRPVTGSVTRIGYRAQTTPQGVLAYRVKATLEGAPPRVGLRGTAKLYGDRAPLGLFLLRRPLGVLRQWLGS
jgi:multidrug resistance efflux pump